MALEHPLSSSQQSPLCARYIINTSSHHIYFQTLAISFLSTGAFPWGCHTLELAKRDTRIHCIKMCPEALPQLWKLDASFSLHRWFHAMPVMNKVRCSS